jgi:hypothetical protein
MAIVRLSRPCVAAAGPVKSPTSATWHRVVTVDECIAILMEPHLTIHNHLRESWPDHLSPEVHHLSLYPDLKTESGRHRHKELTGRNSNADVGHPGPLTKIGNHPPTA